MATFVAQAVTVILGLPALVLSGYLATREDVRQRVVNWTWAILLWPELHKRAAVYSPRHSLSRPVSPSLEHSTSILTQLA
jgi:hypothetical protein